MKVALVVDRFDALAGGLEKWTVQFAGFLIGRGHEVHVVTFEAATDLPVTLHLLSSSPTLVARATAIEHCLEALQADVVHDSGAGWSADVFHPQTGSRLRSLEHEIAAHSRLRRLKAAISPRTQLRRHRMAAMERRQLRRARRVVAVSARIRDYLAADFGVDPAQIDVIRNGVDTAYFDPSRIGQFRTGRRDGLGVADTTALCLCSAHNLRLKGVDTAIRAVAQIRRSGCDIHLAVAGGVPDAEWRALAAASGGSDTVTFLGQVDDMRPVFAASDIYVHPTRWDACSLSTIEAAAAGLPVITTAINGAAELIDDGITGFVLADPDDVTSLSVRLRALLDPGLRRRIGNAALAASKQHDLDTNLAAVEAVLARCVRQ